jgi:hypothetical protein
MSNEDSPEDDGERSGSGRGGANGKRAAAGGPKTKRNARQQDQNKQARARCWEGCLLEQRMRAAAWLPCLALNCWAYLVWATPAEL